MSAETFRSPRKSTLRGASRAKMRVFQKCGRLSLRRVVHLQNLLLTIYKLRYNSARIPAFPSGGSLWQQP
jgi:hypothetical protein